MTIDEAYNRLLITLSAVDDGALCSCCVGGEGSDQLFRSAVSRCAGLQASSPFHDDYCFINNKYEINGDRESWKSIIRQCRL